MFKYKKTVMPEGLNEDEQYEFVSKLRTRILVRTLGCMYLAWLDFGIIRLYLKGSTSLSLPLFILVVAVFTAVVVWVGLFSWYQWKDLKEMREALARRQQEKNASAWEGDMDPDDEEDDDDYDEDGDEDEEADKYEDGEADGNEEP